MFGSIIIWRAIKESMSGVKYRLLFAATTLLMFALFVLIPVKTVPGNALNIQLSIFTVGDYALLAFLSLLYALFIVMQAYVFRFARRHAASSIGKTIGGSFSALFAGIAGTAFCASCLAPLFALFGIGFGGALFVLDYRLYFVAAIVVIMLFALYFVSKRIVGICGNKKRVS